MLIFTLTSRASFSKNSAKFVKKRRFRQKNMINIPNPPQRVKETARPPGGSGKTIPFRGHPGFHVADQFSATVRSITRQGGVPARGSPRNTSSLFGPGEVAVHSAVEQSRSVTITAYLARSSLFSLISYFFSLTSCFKT